MKISNILILLTCSLLFIGCTTSSPNGFVIPPNGGAALLLKEPVWISGIQIDNIEYFSDLPKAEENGELKVVNAGYCLVNSNGRISNLVYTLQLNVKKPFSENKVYTRAILTNPEDINNPIVYEHYLNSNERSTKVTHSPVLKAQMGKTYHMIFEVYDDVNRTNLMSRIDQPIISLVDNENGCVKLKKEFMEAKFKNTLDPQGRVIPTDKLIIACKREVQNKN